LAEKIFKAPASAGLMAKGKKGYAICKDSCCAFDAKVTNKNRTIFLIKSDNVTPPAGLELKLQKDDQM
jgi:hypothetical protein